MNYNVIWFDDEFESLNIIKEKALLNGIILHGFTNATDGINELNSKIYKYDAAVVDGKFFKSKTQTLDAVNDSALFDVAIAIEKLSDQKKLPWFILSGQITFTKETNRYAEGFDKNVYDKNLDEHLNQLWFDIKKSADEQFETQIKFRYSNVFELCNNKFLAEETSKPLLTILKSIHGSENKFDDELYFGQIRLIVESLFRTANKFGLLHDKCIEGGKVNLTESSLYLAGEATKHLGIKCSKTHFPKIVANNVKSILFVTGAAAHTQDPEIKENINIADHRQLVNTPYLLFALTFQLLDIMLWLKMYIDKNSNIEINKSYWSLETGWVKGIVINVNEAKGYAFFKPIESGNNVIIPPNIFNAASIKNDDYVEVIIEDYIDEKSKEKKFRVSDLKKAS